MTENTVSVVCPHCGHDRVYPLGRRGAFYQFECEACNGLLELQERETAEERLARCAARLERCADQLEGVTR